MLCRFFQPLFRVSSILPIRQLYRIRASYQTSELQVEMLATMKKGWNSRQYPASSGCRNIVSGSLQLTHWLESNLRTPFCSVTGAICFASAHNRPHSTISNSTSLLNLSLIASHACILSYRSATR